MTPPERPEAPRGPGERYGDADRRADETAPVDALTALETCRAMRYLRPDPVPEDLIRRVVRAATCASSPRNTQGWDFVVVRDRERRDPIARAVRAAVKPLMPAVPQDGEPGRRHMLAGVHHLLDHLEDVPVWIFVCGLPVYPPDQPSRDWILAALYPAAQNLIVAARAVGLGSVFTMYHAFAEREIRAILDLPPEAMIGVTVPLGWPARSFGPLRRRTVDEVLHWERW